LINPSSQMMNIVTDAHKVEIEDVPVSYPTAIFWAE
jgi:hypothetical protein